jgi:HIP---CoA ligase
MIAPARFLGRDYVSEAAGAVGQARVIAIEATRPAGPGIRTWQDVLAAGREADPAELADRIARQSGDDVVVIQYTSGTTGQPKGAALRQGPMLGTAAQWGVVTGLGRGDVYPVTYPLAHVGGFKTGLLSNMIARSAAALFPVVDTESLVRVISELKPGVVNGPPPVLRSLLAALDSGQLSPRTRIRTVVTGSAIVPPALVRELAEKFGTEDVIIGYGLTEATGVCTMTRRGDPIELVCESIGAPLDGMEVRIGGNGDGESAKVGEIQVRGPNVMTGYWDNPDATDEVMDGDWLRTGDLGWVDEGGYVHIAGRSKDMVVVGGFNVYPAEVEHVLAEHPDVAEAAAVGVPDTRLGEVIAAFVVPAPGAKPAATALTGWVRERLANYKVPRHIWTLEALPKGSLGKVAKAELSARAAELLEGSRDD